MKVLVTGGAGYIGSTVASALQDAGDEPVIVDDLSRGSAAFLRDIPHYVGDVSDRGVIDRIFRDHPDIAVTVHCAARIVVPESVADPLGYYRANVAKTVDLLDALLAHRCHRVIFSSSAAVYGPASPVVTETSPVLPESPYAWTKVIVERMLADACLVTPLSALSLRYFNPVGCDPRHRSWPYDPTPTHALGSLMRAWSDGAPFRIHGDDWDTPDGTPVRDFVHVWDVALAHVSAIHDWTAPAERFDIVNVGSGRATSVLQLAEAFNARVPDPVPIEYDGRRVGDLVGCYTSVAKAAEVLGWRPTRSVVDAIDDLLALAAQRASG